MIDGGQQLTGIDTHLQMGSELFDSDPKGALAAYYQAVSLDASHIEGWNQIGRLMFDLEQYSEAEMVFKRVESLANEQNLPDWAEMAVQNIELAQQSIGAGDAIAPAVQEEASEEAKSIEDISNIAAVAQIPEIAAQVVEVAVPEGTVADVAQPVGIQIPTVEAAPIVAPVPEISVSQIAPVPEVAPLPEIAPMPEVAPCSRGLVAGCCASGQRCPANSSSDTSATRSGQHFCGDCNAASSWTSAFPLL